MGWDDRIIPEKQKLPNIKPLANIIHISIRRHFQSLFILDILDKTEQVIVVHKRITIHIEAIERELLSRFNQFLVLQLQLQYLLTHLFEECFVVDW